MPAARDPARRPPLAAVVAGVLALPAALLTLLFGNAALGVAGDTSGGATWLILLITIGWTVGLLAGAARLLTGRSWLGLAVCAGLLAVLATVNLVTAGFGGPSTGLLVFSWLAAVGTAVLAALPGVRGWVAGRRRERLYPGSTQRSGSRS